MESWVRQVCGYVYVPADNDNVAFADLPEEWTCPTYGSDKDSFEQE